MTGASIANKAPSAKPATTRRGGHWWRRRGAYQYTAKVSALMARRQADLPKAALDIAWKTQVQICARFRRLAARGVNRNKIVVAIVRELAGFVCAIAQHLKPV
jgi:transposase